MECNPGKTFPRHRRIRKHADYERMFAAGNAANKWFVVYARRNVGGSSRLGIVASKRIMPTAVSRNFTKRLVREVFRLNLSAESALDVVVRARKQLDPNTSAEGRLALIKLLQAIQP